MSLLVIQPSLRKCEYSIFSNGLKSIFSETIAANENWAKIAKTIHENYQRTDDCGAIETIAIKVLFGGEEFTGPVIADSQVISRLESITQHAPLHLPIAIQLIEGCKETFGDVPAVLVFETSFFVNLPGRERMYGISPKLSEKMKIRRFGYNGIYHEAACKLAIRNLRSEGTHGASKIISICLETRPEVAAIRGNMVLMVTGGSTAMEGMPGEMSCGEIDPSIVLMLTKKKKWGPEKINTILTQGSGLKGLVGEATKLTAVFDKTKPSYNTARRILRYRMLNVVGAAIAAMGGIDAVVYSGKYIEAAGFIHKYLNDNLFSKLHLHGKVVKSYNFNESLGQLIAEKATAFTAHLCLSKIE